MTMWSDDTDLTQLAQRLWVGPRELIEAIGGPWFVVRRSYEQEMALPGTLFVGRAGPSVAVLVSDDTVPSLRVGTGEGEWVDPGTLVWSVTEPAAELACVGPDASDAEVAAMLSALAGAVDDAYEAKRPSLVICRYCGTLVAPEHALGDDMCHGCGSRILGIVY